MLLFGSRIVEVKLHRLNLQEVNSALSTVSTPLQQTLKVNTRNDLSRLSIIETNPFDERVREEGGRIGKIG